MPILQRSGVPEQKSVMYMDVLYADFAGAKIGDNAIAVKLSL